MKAPLSDIGLILVSTDFIFHLFSYCFNFILHPSFCATIPDAFARLTRARVPV